MDSIYDIKNTDWYYNTEYKNGCNVNLVHSNNHLKYIINVI
jgi:hypothetical protein